MALSAPVGVSASAYGLVTIDEAVAVFVAAGARHVELAIGPRWTSSTRSSLRAYVRDGLTFSGHHAFALDGGERPFDLGERFRPDDHAPRLDLLAELGARRYSVHAASGARDDRPATLRRFVERFVTLREMASARGLTLGVETMFPLRRGDRRYLADDLASVRELAEALPGVPWVLDLAHLGLWGRREGAAALAALHGVPLLEVHLSDNDGHSDTHAPIHDGTWWVEQLARVDASVPWVIESRMLRHDAPAIAKELQRVAALRAERATNSSAQGASTSSGVEDDLDLTRCGRAIRGRDDAEP